MADAKVTLNVENFPAALRERTKALAAERGMNLKGAVIQALRHWCEDREEDHRQTVAYGLQPNTRVPPPRREP
jgi:hypothetical protein